MEIAEIDPTADHSASGRWHDQQATPPRQQINQFLRVSSFTAWRFLFFFMIQADTLEQLVAMAKIYRAGVMGTSNASIRWFAKAAMANQIGARTAAQVYSVRSCRKPGKVISTHSSRSESIFQFSGADRLLVEPCVPTFAQNKLAAFRC